MAYLNETRAASAGFADRLGAFVKSLREAARRRAVYRHTLRELRSLSTRELNDLGINQSMITRIALEAAYGK